MPIDTRSFRIGAGLLLLIMINCAESKRGGDEGGREGKGDGGASGGNPSRSGGYGWSNEVQGAPGSGSQDQSGAGGSGERGEVNSKIGTSGNGKSGGKPRNQAPRSDYRGYGVYTDANRGGYSGYNDLFSKYPIFTTKSSRFIAGYLLSSFYDCDWGYVAGIPKVFSVGIPTSAIYVPTYKHYYYFGGQHYNERAKPSDMRKCTYNITEKEIHFKLVYETTKKPITEIIYECEASGECCYGLECCSGVSSSIIASVIGSFLVISILIFFCVRCCVGKQNQAESDFAKQNVVPKPDSTPASPSSLLNKTPFQQNPSPSIGLSAYPPEPNVNPIGLEKQALAQSVHPTYNTGNQVMPTLPIKSDLSPVPPEAVYPPAPPVPPYPTKI